MKSPIYLDNHATTRVDPRVFEAMRPWFCENFGNASSKSHAFGWVAEAAVEKARRQVASLLGAGEKEILFTSGATEANNLALLGGLQACASRGNHVVTVATEHKAVLDPLKHASAQVSFLGVGADGRIDLGALENALQGQTVMVSVMLANNEIGVIQPISEIGRICRQRGILFHCDAAQGIGKLPFHVDEAQVDLVSLSAHKLYGPKGVGALYVRRKPRVDLSPVQFGGSQERGLRPGTLNVPGIVGLGEACALARSEMAVEAPRTQALRNRLLEGLWQNLDGLTVNGSLEYRLPGNLNVSFEGVEGEALMLSMRDIAVSAGSACASASLAPSHVLTALGLSDAQARSALRFGIGRFNTEEEIDYVVAQVTQQVKKLRGIHARAHGANSLKEPV